MTALEAYEQARRASPDGFVDALIWFAAYEQSRGLRFGTAEAAEAYREMMRTYGDDRGFKKVG